MPKDNYDTRLKEGEEEFDEQDNDFDVVCDFDDELEEED